MTVGHPFVGRAGRPSRFSGGQRTVARAFRCSLSAGASRSKYMYAWGTSTRPASMQARTKFSSGFCAIQPRAFSIVRCTKGKSLGPHLHERANPSFKRTCLRQAA